MSSAAHVAVPQRPSQVVHETSVPTPEGKHIVVTLERVSTGGTRRSASFTKAADKAMTGAERAEKKRLRKSLFPDEQAAARDQDAKRKRVARTESAKRECVREKAAAPLPLVSTAAAECTEEDAEIVQRRKQRQHKQQMKRAEDGALDFHSLLAEHMEYAVHDHGVSRPCRCYWCCENGKRWQPSDVSDECRRRALEHMQQVLFCPCAECRSRYGNGLEDVWNAVNAELGSVPDHAVCPRCNRCDNLCRKGPCSLLNLGVL